MAEENNKNINLPTESQVKKSGFSGFMSKLFGWQRTKSGSNIEMVNVDIGSKKRISQAMMNSMEVNKTPMSERVEDLFDRWLVDNTDKISELQDRNQRVEQLSYMTLNDPYVNRAVALYADEATQLDSQNNVIQIETPDPMMTKDMYELMTKWGLTQNRVRSTIEQLGEYGDAFWANKITENGVERIIPLQQRQVSNRLEFNPIKVLEMKKRRNGSFEVFASNNYLIQKMLEELGSEGDFTEMFNTKLFGFHIDDDLVVPPWSITHFRVNADGSQFAPWGESPILGAISPFKQTQSTIALQSLARMTNFPITLFKVKTSDSMDEARQFGVVNRVREAFDNIGVSPQVGSSEVYTNNTKVWLPEGLVNVEVVRADSANSGNVDDISLYQNREAIALSLPKSFFGDEGWYSSGDSGKALTRQYKPLARRVFTLQSAFTDGLSDLFRIHFAITGIYDYRTPFTISMKYPAVEETDERTAMEKTSIEVAQSVIEVVKAAIGAGEDESLPPDIVRDILASYTFLNPNDIMKWTRDAKFSRSINTEEGGTSGSDGMDLGGDSGGIDLGGDSDGMDLGGGDDSEGMDLGGDDNVSESYNTTDNHRIREKKFNEIYRTKRDKIYFQILKENAVNSFVRGEKHVQVYYEASPSMDLMLKVLDESRLSESERLQESFIRRNSKKRRKSK